MTPSSFSQPLDPHPTGWKIYVCNCRSTVFTIKLDPNDKIHYYCGKCGEEHQSTKSKICHDTV